MVGSGGDEGGVPGGGVPDPFSTPGGATGDAVVDAAVDVPLVYLGRRVRARRLALGLTQEDLAARSGLHRTYVSGLESGLRNSSLENLLRVAAALDVRLAELLGDL